MTLARQPTEFTMTNNDTTYIVGYGALGKEIARQMTAAGRPVTIIQRRKPKDFPPGARFLSADIMDREAIVAALADAGSVICALGLPYQAALWETGWPRAMANLLDACEAAGARLVFADNLYLYGPVDGPLTEDLPTVGYGRKPRARAEVTRLWQEAHASGRVKVATVRSPDFYGPGVEQSVLGSASLMTLAKGKRAMLLGDADLPHDVAHVADYARAVITLRDAEDDAYGQAWHVPCAPTLTLRQHLSIAADSLGVPLRLTVLPRWLAPVIGKFVPFVEEGVEMQFLFDRPYVVKADKFRRRFWSDVTPFETGLPAAAEYFHTAA
jgi:nucleoside-diphosphate-sugar epimerase